VVGVTIDGIVRVFSISELVLSCGVFGWGRLLIGFLGGVVLL